MTALMKSGRLGHGYLLCGSSMVGKRTFAQSFANFLETGLFELPSAESVLQDTKIIDAATTDSIGIDAVREIKNFLWQKPIASPRRTLIIDEAELLTAEAQNALLKVTEEPPASSLLLIVTTDEESILPTIVSRLPQVYFGAVPEAEIALWLVEHQGLTKTKAAPLAKKAIGKPGLALRLLSDEKFQKNLELAEKYLKSTKTTRKDIIKKIIEPDDFSMRIFLESVIISLAWEKPIAARAALWHRTLALYGNVTNFGLNPRLQLEALLA